MRLLTSAVFIVSMISSWAVVDVLACKNNNMLTKRMPPSKNEGESTGKSSKNCESISPWMTMKVMEAETIPNGHVKLYGNYLKITNPVVKIIYTKNEIEMQSTYARIASLEHCIAGWFMPLKDERVVLFLMMPDMGVALLKDTSQQKGDTIEYYLDKHQIYHPENSITYYAPKPGETGMLRLVKEIWEFSQNNLKALPPPPPSPADSPPPPKIQVGTNPSLASPLNVMEAFILQYKPEFLWGNNEANYYKFAPGITDKSLVLKVSWIVGTVELRSFLIQALNTIKVGQLEYAGILKINSKEDIYISYLIVFFPGEMDKKGKLGRSKKSRLQKDAISRYEREYKMINTRISDDYFVYNMTEDKAYIYDWSRARHTDLPKVTKICSPEMNWIKTLPKDTFMREFYATQSPPTG